MKATLYRGGILHGHAATALLVRGTAIAWLGADDDAPTADRVVDLEGAWVAPAFVDAHVHVTATGLALTGLDLTGCPSLADALRRVGDEAKRLRGGVLLGTGWDETAWPESRPPTAAELDRVTYGGVVYLARTDVHSAVASSALLAAVPGAAALPGYLGEGLVTKDAHHAVRRSALESVSPAQRRAVQVAALDRMAALGIGSVHECAGPDISGEEDFTALLALDHPVERIGYWGELGAIDRARDLGAVGAAGDLFVDGAIGSHTACLTDSYADSAGFGDSFLDARQVAEHVVACTHAGIQAGFHVIGDAATEIVIRGIAQSAHEVGSAAIRAARHRLEHLEMINTEQIAVLAACGFIASVQPAFDARWGGPSGMYAERLGPDRARGMNPFGAMQAAGLTMAFGSDSPVTAPDPWGSVLAAVVHQTAGSGLPPEAAFAAHTDGGWLAAGRPGAGALRVDGPASFAAWDLEEPLHNGLPNFSAALPSCRLTVLHGATAFGPTAG